MFRTSPHIDNSTLIFSTLLLDPKTLISCLCVCVCVCVCVRVRACMCLCACMQNYHQERTQTALIPQSVTKAWRSQRPPCWLCITQTKAMAGNSHKPSSVAEETAGHFHSDSPRVQLTAGMLCPGILFLSVQILYNPEAGGGEERALMYRESQAQPQSCQRRRAVGLPQRQTRRVTARWWPYW